MALISISYTIVQDISTMRRGATVHFDDTELFLHSTGQIKKALAEVFGVPESNVVQTYTYLQWKIAFEREQLALYEAMLQYLRSEGQDHWSTTDESFTADEVQEYLYASKEALEKAELHLATCPYRPVEPLDGPYPEQTMSEKDDK